MFDSKCNHNSWLSKDSIWIVSTNPELNRRPVFKRLDLWSWLGKKEKKTEKVQLDSVRKDLYKILQAQSKQIFWLPFNSRESHLNSWNLFKFTIQIGSTFHKSKYYRKVHYGKRNFKKNAITSEFPVRWFFKNVKQLPGKNLFFKICREKSHHHQTFIFTMLWS